MARAGDWGGGAAALLLLALAAGSRLCGGEEPPPVVIASQEENTAFQRFQHRLERGLPTFASQGAAAWSTQSPTSLAKPRPDYIPLPRERGEWPTRFRVMVENGALFVPTPPDAKHSQARGDHTWAGRWRDRDIVVRLRQTGTDLLKPVDGEEVAELVRSLPSDVDWDAVRREMRSYLALSRFDQWWVVLRTDASAFSLGLPFAKRIVGVYLYYKKSFLDAAVAPYRGAGIRAFVAAPRRETRERRDGDGVMSRWVATAWIAPLRGNPLVELTFSTPDGPEGMLLMETVLEAVAACRFEMNPAAPPPERPRERNWRP